MGGPIIDPPFGGPVPPEAIQAGQAAYEAALPDKIYIYGGPGISGIKGKYNAHFRPGVNPREVTDAVTQRIANRVAWTVKMPARAGAILTDPNALTYKARGFIKDLGTGTVKEIYPLEIVSILPLGSWGLGVKAVLVLTS